ncbi:sensor domain-containing diguanylate cyclase [Sulfoacidibacillus thermotolerans]|uniref:Sensor domain-containing diguanylate cyclase n=1 Tax=Sulfoacidibacillus thermotolerans TaxID=1765684 RepID=A0A2U3D956_SULT2|nr:GGDEF domain-containing protein [Sulfoacidibacillus thermotolerans]PWI57804.1 hypothetical protein BM613_06325 [Sulfoacidibacillus thermotolerans]
MDKEITPALPYDCDPFYAAFTYAQTPSAIVTANGKITHANKALHTLLGYETPALQDINFFTELLYPEDDQELTAFFSEQITAKTSTELKTEKRCLRQDGTALLCQLSIYPFMSRDGQLRYFYLQFEKGAFIPTHLRETQSVSPSLDETFNRMTDAFFTLDHSSKFIYLNRKASELFDLSTATLLDRCIWDVFPTCAFRPYFEFCSKSQTVVTFTEYSDFHQKWFTARLYPLSTGISVYFRDVTEEKNREELLREQERRFRFIVEQSTDLITQISPHGEMTFVSPASLELLGYTPNELVGKNFLSFVSAEDISKLTARLTEFNGHRSMGRFTYRVQAKSGQLIWLESTVRAIYDKQSTLTGFMTVSRDVTQRKRSEQQLLTESAALRRLAELDGLLAIGNRRNFNRQLETQWMLHAAAQSPLSLILLDIDYFKNYNDTYGHLAGDDCLKQIAAAIASLFPDDLALVARYGGEELAVLLPNTDLHTAKAAAEQIRNYVEELQIVHRSSPVFPYVTISAGVACVFPSDYQSSSTIVSFADQALYLAKRKGRNQIAHFHVQDFAKRNTAPQ